MVCCCSLAGTQACEHCNNNNFSFRHSTPITYIYHNDDKTNQYDINVEKDSIIIEGLTKHLDKLKEENQKLKEELAKIKGESYEIY